MWSLLGLPPLARQFPRLPLLDLQFLLVGHASLVNATPLPGGEVLVLLSSGDCPLIKKGSGI